MYKTGHIGAALLVYSPIGLSLLLVGFDELAVLGGVGMVALASLPDCDHRLPIIAHRGPTHSVVFALLIGGVLGIAGFASGEALASVPALTMGVFGFGIGTLAVLSHLAADCVTPMGVRPLWPLSRWHYSANLVRANNPIVNYLLFAIGIAAATAALVLAGRF